MKKIIVEVGSTSTKIDLYDGEKITRIREVTIQFKKHYNENKVLNENDINTLINTVNELKSITENIYLCGTSIFRSLKLDEKEVFLTRIKKETNSDFQIISSDEENELTVYGVAHNINEKIAVMIGGGGSTELAIYDKEIIEIKNSTIGVIDINERFPDLTDDIATTNLKDIIEYIKENPNLPENKCDILVLAGGLHKYFAETSGINYEVNKLYNDINQPIMMDIKTRKEDTERFYKEISLDKIKSKVEDPGWWNGTRAMCAFALAVAESIEAKYIIPTDISMAYGIANTK